MRLFYAALFSPATLSNLIKIQEELKNAGVKGRFIPRSNLHMTLCFIGETDPGDVFRLSGCLDEVAGNYHPEELELTGIGMFRQGRHELLYAGVYDSSGGLFDAATLLGYGSGKGDRRPLKPHITLVRNAVIPGDLRQTIRSRSFALPAFSIQSLALMESRPGRGGVV
jgi:2'-5' RNA ligase